VIEKTFKDWEKEGIELFGDNKRFWKFVCPCCGFVQCGDDFIKAGVSIKTATSMTGFSCIGRVLPECRDAFEKGPGPCNYAGGGLFPLNPIRIIFDGDHSNNFFDFYRGEKCLRK
jgi:hypothetical protein